MCVLKRIYTHNKLSKSKFAWNNFFKKNFFSKLYNSHKVLDILFEQFLYLYIYIYIFNDDVVRYQIFKYSDILFIRYSETYKISIIFRKHQDG